MEFDTNLDYLTVTIGCAREWRESVNNLLRTIQLGSKRRPWRFLNYSGYTVESVHGHCSWGAGSQRGGIFQASGLIAAAMARTAEKWLPSEFRITRLDLAVTFGLGETQRLVEEAMHAPREGWRAILPHPDEGGGTLYVGDRKSERFGRLYDKGAQLNPDLPDELKIPVARLWRAEVEYKRGAAREAYQQWRAKSEPDGRREFVCDTVLTWFQDHGVWLPVMTTSPSVVSVATRAVDDVRTLRWFHEQVRPAMFRLVENGKALEVEKALHLQERTLSLRDLGHIGETSLQFSFFDKEQFPG